MFPYRFDTPSPTPSAPLPPPSTPPTPSTPTRPRRWLRRTLLAGALVLATVGGGAAGALATMRLSPPASAPVISQPILAPVAPASSIAGSVYGSAGPAVVEIGVRGARGGGTGSGVVVAGDGRILTNYHVVENARSIAVRFSDGTTRSAQVLRTDEANDLAVIQVELPAGSVVAPLGDSDTVQVGETVVAIGNPYGLEQTVTQGIVSAMHRDRAANGPQNLIQTDAPINPGNSGGPLLNANGEVIGINASIASPVRGSVGIGFAIPINTAKQLLA